MVGSLSVLLVGVMVACGDQEERSLCSAYAQYVAAVQPVIGADPTGATAGDALAAVDDLLAEATQLRAVADGQYESIAAELVEALTDLQVTLAGAPATADFATWQPLVADLIDTATDADDRLQEALDVECGGAS